MGGAKTKLILSVVCSIFIVVSCRCTNGLWYSTNSNKCVLCTKCGPNKFVVAPCDSYRDVICASFGELNFDFLKIPMETARPTHEIEFQGVVNWAPTYGKQEAVIQTEMNNNGMVAGNPVILGLAIGCTVGGIFVLIILVVISCHFRRSEGRHSQTRARLFSRDRLNTTEYRHTLAFLDRKLAMDEILEKKRAALEPCDERGNIYTDDVFVDLTSPSTEGVRLLRNA